MSDPLSAKSVQAVTSSPAVAWRVVAASIPGVRHQRQNQPCQDAVRWQLAGDGTLVVAVADGAGSAKLGEVGAATAAAAGIEALHATLARGDMLREEAKAVAQLKASLQAAQAAVRAEAANRKAPLGDLATTLLLCVAGRDGLAAAQVGDGAVVFADSQGQWKSLTKPAGGEYLNETLFLTSDAALDRAQCQVWTGRAQHLALFSDGLQMLALKMPEAVPHPPFFDPLFAWLGRKEDGAAAQGDLAAWLGSPRVTERTDDDLTLLLAKRME